MEGRVLGHGREDVCGGSEKIVGPETNLTLGFGVGRIGRPCIFLRSVINLTLGGWQGCCDGK